MALSLLVPQVVAQTVASKELVLVLVPVAKPALLPEMVALLWHVVESSLLRMVVAAAFAFAI